jgi:hypothetical protein
MIHIVINAERKQDLKMKSIMLKSGLKTVKKKNGILIKTRKNVQFFIIKT